LTCAGVRIINCRNDYLKGGAQMKEISGLVLIAAGVLAVAQPAAAQNAAAKPCTAGPWTVFFGSDDDAVTPAAAATLDKVAAAYRACGDAQVTIAGHTDRERPDQYNVGLSQREAMNVRSYLAGKGVPDGVMTTQAFGESRPLVPTRDGVRQAKNRRVEIVFGPGAGW
jgi:outer membrane protein OmpA-like peptidoglycan-associated protein